MLGDNFGIQEHENGRRNTSPFLPRFLTCACQVFHCNLPLYLLEEIERFQRRALGVIFPDCSYSEGLAKAGLTTLHDRRSTLCKELFSDIDTQGNHKLSHLLPVRSQQNYNLRSTRAFARLSARQTGSETALSLAIV